MELGIIHCTSHLSFSVPSSELIPLSHLVVMYVCLFPAASKKEYLISVFYFVLLKAGPEDSGVSFGCFGLDQDILTTCQVAIKILLWIFMVFKG